jgi:hypothetical protein
LAATQIIIAFERSYHVIFGSQLVALKLLASSSNAVVDPESLRPFYEQAKSKHAEFYGAFTFENWLSFLQTQYLVARQADKVGISVRGREFLKFLIDQGYGVKKAG